MAWDLTPVAPLREAFLASGENYATLARRLGFTAYRNDRNQRVPDTSRVARDLGLVPTNGKPGQQCRQTRKRIGYEKALRYAEALGIDPVELGL